MIVCSDDMDVNLNSPHFYNQFRHFIYQILLYGFKDTNYFIFNEKQKKKYSYADSKTFGLAL